jgi:hypothetical protein
MLQHLDLGITVCVRAKYREAPVQKTITALQNKQRLKLNTLQHLHLVIAAWGSENSETIAHCSSNGQFGVTSVSRNVDEEDGKKTSHNQAVTFTDFAKGDRNVRCQMLSVEDICNAARAEKDKGGGEL